MNKCTIPKCERWHYAKGYCEAHYKRFKAGKDMNIGFRTTERKAKILNDMALIPLGIDAKDGYMIVDKEFSYLDKYKCSLSKRGYPVAFINGKITNLHSIIIGKPPKGLVTDHINRDKLDNRIENLRLVSQKVNVRNAGMLNTNTSGYKGVCFNKKNNKWFAQSAFNGKNQFGGYYETKEEAILARQKLMDKYSNNSK